MPFYRNILKQAWSLTWHNKYLWWLGIFAALLGNGGELEILFNNNGANPGQSIFPGLKRIASTGVFKAQTYDNIIDLFRYDTLNMVIVLIMSLFVLAVFILLVWLVISSQGALVNGAAALLNKRKTALRQNWDAGVLNFWPVLSINILLKIVIYILLALISLPLIFWSGNSGSWLLYVLAAIIIIPLAIILSFIAKYSIAYVVINGEKAGEALRRSIKLFKENWLISFEMAVILFFINIIVGLLIVLCILALAAPFLFLGIILFYIFSSLGSYLIAILGFAAFLFIIITGGAALAVFQITVWTSLFLELDKKRGISKLMRVVNNIIK